MKIDLNIYLHSTGENAVRENREWTGNFRVLEGNSKIPMDKNAGTTKNQDVFRLRQTVVVLRESN